MSWNIIIPKAHIATGITNIPNTANGATCIFMIPPPIMGLRTAAIAINVLLV
jgi:hypothetical protein